MNRRNFNKTVGLGLTGAAIAVGAQGADEARTAAEAPAAAPPATSAASGGAATRPAGAPPFSIGMIIFDNMTALDFVAPQDAFAHLRAAKVHVLAKTRSSVTTDTGLKITPDLALGEAPDLDLIFIGGGNGTTALMEDPVVISFLQQRAPRAQWITSVCTGALVLGAAGLLRGYKAATHWAAMEVLPLLGAEPVHERVVTDRNRITGGGVTAGLDFALTVVARLYGDNMAQLIQLAQEYEPTPPFSAGSPRTAPPATVQQFRGLIAKVTEERFAAARRAAAKFS